MEGVKWLFWLTLLKILSPLLTFLIGYFIPSPKQRKQEKANVGNDS